MKRKRFKRIMCNFVAQITGRKMPRRKYSLSELYRILLRTNRQ